MTKSKLLPSPGVGLKIRSRIRVKSTFPLISGWNAFLEEATRGIDKFEVGCGMFRFEREPKPNGGGENILIESSTVLNNEKDFSKFDQIDRESYHLLAKNPIIDRIRASLANEKSTVLTLRKKLEKRKSH
ncbi:hypothetical protein L6164_037853 [Bauhinia variegata]|uniref:Uncharacterized protein n=1 Tax=Bauhinia variegata TaxID=167791 RepID=A0ACB9KLB8_BAUVA|nr:hypothetical protein L6164_037853 [Bauhinia variegata]